MPNRASKNISRKQRYFLPHRISILAGLAWIVILISLLVKVDKSSILNSVFLQIPLLYIGGLLISDGLVRSSKKTLDETNSNQRSRIFFFAAGVSIAGFVIYAWAHLFINGLY